MIIPSAFGLQNLLSLFKGNATPGVCVTRGGRQVKERHSMIGSLLLWKADGLSGELRNDCDENSWFGRLSDRGFGRQ